MTLRLGRTLLRLGRRRSAHVRSQGVRQNSAGVYAPVLAQTIAQHGITLVAISILTFTIIQLPPGDYVSTQIAQLQRMDVDINQSMS